MSKISTFITTIALLILSLNSIGQVNVAFYVKDSLSYQCDTTVTGQATYYDLQDTSYITSSNYGVIHYKETVYGSVITVLSDKHPNAPPINVAVKLGEGDAYNQVIFDYGNAYYILYGDGVIILCGW